MLKRHRYSFGLFWLISIFLLPLPFIQTLSNGLPIIYQNEYRAIYYGTIAYVWMLLAIYLSTKPKWLDRLIGLPEMYQVHGILSIAAIVLAYLHKEGTISSGWIKTTGDWSFDLFLGLMIYSLIFMAGWLTNRFHILKRLKQNLEKLFKHELSIWIHRLNIVAVSLTFIHVQLITYITAIKPFIYLFDGVSAVLLVCYLFSKFVKPLTYEQGILLSNRTISQNIQELVIRLPRSSRIELLAGDYVFMAFPDYKELREMHPFSIVNVPNKDRKIILIIRGDGDFTRCLKNVLVESRVNIDGGYGRYQYFLNSQSLDTNIVILAGGIGVTPLLSIIAANLNRNINVFYSAHRETDLLYTSKLAVWDKRNNVNCHVQVGRFSDLQVLGELPEEWTSNTVFLIGGPSPMMHHWIRLLKDNGASNGQICYEEFSW